MGIDASIPNTVSLTKNGNFCARVCVSSSVGIFVMNSSNLDIFFLFDKLKSGYHNAMELTSESSLGS